MLKDFSYNKFWSRKGGLLERQIIAADYYLSRTKNAPSKIGYPRSGVNSNGTPVFEAGRIPYSITDIICQVPNKDGLFDVSFNHPLDYKIKTHAPEPGKEHNFSMHIFTVVKKKHSRARGTTTTFFPHNLYGPSDIYVTNEEDNGTSVFPYSYSSAYMVYGEKVTPKELKSIHEFAAAANISVALSALVLKGFNIRPEDAAGCKRIITFFQSVHKANLFNVKPGTFVAPAVNNEIFDHLTGAGITIPEQLVAQDNRNFFKIRDYYNAIGIWAIDEMKETMMGM